MKPNVLLFDVDGTLVDTGGAGRRAVEAAFRELYAGAQPLEFSFAGMTDRAIVKEGLRRVGAQEREGRVEQLFTLYLEHLSREVEASANYSVCPGVESLLQRVRRRRSTHAVGLGTGNIQRGAQIKLRRAGLDRAFSFGGFGSDHEDRAELLRVGAERGAAELGVPLGECRVVVIGDTPRDIAAAAAVGAECVAVATGPFDVGELRRCRPTVVCETLEASAAVAAVLGDMG